MNRLLRSRRNEALLTQAELAEELGVAEISVRRWEAGDRPQPKYLRKLCEFLHASPEQLGFLAAHDQQDAGTSERQAPTPTVDNQVGKSQHDWLQTRHLLNQHRSALTKLATELYPPSMRLAQTGILMPPEWRPSNPTELGSIDLTLTDTDPPPVNGRHEETRRLRPLVAPNRPYDTYHRAMRDLARPRLFENRVCYRLLDAQANVNHAHLTVGHMRYFDMIDVGEALAHELALVAVDQHGNVKNDPPSWDQLPFRRLVRDPLNLKAYPLLLSISTLTIRYSKAGTTFLLLRRGVDQVAIAGGMLSVMPTGVFQPASILPTRDSPDFNLWHNMMREFSEEFLGNPEHDGSGDAIDYENDEPLRSLNIARRTGKIRVFCLGIGIDALNLVGDVLTVAVFEADVFDRIFDGLVELNDEGTVTRGGQSQEHFSFDKATIQHLLATEPIAPSGAACLHLAWEHQATVLRDPST